MIVFACCLSRFHHNRLFFLHSNGLVFYLSTLEAINLMLYAYSLF